MDGGYLVTDILIERIRLHLYDFYIFSS